MELKALQQPALDRIDEEPELEEAPEAPPAAPEAPALEVVPEAAPMDPPPSPGQRAWLATCRRFNAAAARWRH